MTGHKGKAQVVIRSEGVSAHGAAPEKGVNAVYPMAAVIGRVERRNRELAAAPAPRGTLALTNISSESVSLNAVPSACEIYLDRRIGPGETEEAVRREFDALVEGTGARWEPGTLLRKTWTGLEVEYVPFHAAWRLPEDAQLARAFAAAREEVLGPDGRGFGFWDFSTNAVSTVRAGIPTIGFGPGDFTLAHMRDERCPVAEIVEACETYAHFIRRFFKS
jgi:acetylornithine deacetylase/succinyl-diaminopimelate desuccinylase-like protein